MPFSIKGTSIPVEVGVTVKITHGSVWITVLQSRFPYGTVCAIERKKDYQIKIKKIRTYNLTTSISTNKYNRAKI